MHNFLMFLDFTIVHLLYPPSSLGSNNITIFYLEQFLDALEAVQFYILAR